MKAIDESMPLVQLAVYGTCASCSVVVPAQVCRMSVALQRFDLVG
jgi:hypothetical protein